MAIGMTYEQYWYGDPLMVRAYYKADRLRQERMNEQAWLYGSYVLRAIDSTIGNAFKKQGTRPSEYPRKPIEIVKKEETEEEREAREEQEAVYAEAYMMNMVMAGKNWKK